MDETDWKILRELQADARLSYRQLSCRVHLSAPSVAERVRRLEREGVITGYRVEVDAERAGYAVAALVSMKTQGPGTCERFAARVPQLPGVVQCHRVTGAESYVLKVVCASMNELEELVDELVKFGEPTTSIILSSPVDHRALPPSPGLVPVPEAV